jgi:hypothetical protein
MERHVERLVASGKSLQVAEHLLTQTLPLVKETKLLLTVLSHLRDAYLHALCAAVLCENKQRPLVSDMSDYSLMLNLFRVKYSKKYGVDIEMLKYAEEIQELFLSHKKSPVAFTRKETIVICDKDFSQKTLSSDILSKHISHAKLFIQTIASSATYAPR